MYYYRYVFTRVCLSTGEGGLQAQGEVGGSLGSYPGGRLGIWPGGVQAHTQGKVRGLGVGCPGPGPVGRLCIPVCTEVDPPKQTATAADSTHPTGMHSCHCHKIIKKYVKLMIVVFQIRIF